MGAPHRAGRSLGEAARGLGGCKGLGREGPCHLPASRGADLLPLFPSRVVHPQAFSGEQGESLGKIHLAPKANGHWWGAARLALGSINTNKMSGGDGIPAELIRSLKEDDALSTSANLENTALDMGLEKVSFHSNPKKDNAK